MAAKKLIFYILSDFVLGTLLLIFIQYNTSKNISNLITGYEKLLSEFKVGNQLKDLEKDIIAVESKIRGTVTTKDTIHIEGQEKQIQQIEAELLQLQKISDDDNSVKYIDELDYMVHEKLKSSHQILDSFNKVGKITAENVIASQKGKLLTNSVIAMLHKIDSRRKNLLKIITTTINKSGSKALRFSTVLIALALISAAALFWYIINTIRRQIILIELNISEKKEKKLHR
jgi:CHASE3 domain sensor protein